MAGQKILIIDDDPNLLKLVELILRRAQYDVITSLTGEIGIEKARDEKPDLILMDVMLPGIDGFQATRQIRRLPECATVPIVFLSASDSTESKVKGLRGGGNDYITKPVKTGELLARIEAHLRPAAVNVAQTIAVFGSKPGVGTTTLAVNLTLALHHTTQKKVIIVDWQRPLGDVAFMLGMPEVRALDFILSQQNLDEETLMDLAPEYVPGLWTIPGSTAHSTAAQMDRRALNILIRAAQPKTDYIIVDAGAAAGWEDLPLIARGDGMNICLLTREPLAIRRAAQLAQQVKDRDNVVWFVLNHYPPSGGVLPNQIEAALGVSLQGHLPNGRDDRDHTLNAAPPLYRRDPQSNFALAVEQLTNHICKVLV
jgi:DNA-binding response OmpR family regulator